MYDHIMRCLSCNYALANLTEHRCPECGRGFDPSDARTFLHSQGRRSASSRIIVIFLIIAAVTAGVMAISLGMMSFM